MTFQRCHEAQPRTTDGICPIGIHAAHHGEKIRVTITLKAVDAKDGKASKFVGTDPGVGNVADFDGTILGKIDGVPSKGEFKE